MASAPITVDVVRIEDGPESLMSTKCSRCQSDVDVHQPDPQKPDRLLAVCALCCSWSLMFCKSGIMAVLPDWETLQTLL